MPMQRHLYPANWEAIARAIKDRADWTCEWCGAACRRPSEVWIDFLKRQNWTLAACLAAKPGQYTLTVAHLNHQPEDCDAANLRALCAPCHCRYDLAAMGRKKCLKAERNGQINLFDLAPPTAAGHGRDWSRIQIPIRER